MNSWKFLAKNESLVIQLKIANYLKNMEIELSIRVKP